MATEKDLDRALENALKNDAEFLRWFVDRTRFKGVVPTFVWSRSDNPWCKVKLDLPNVETGESEPILRDSETDVLFVFRSESGKRLALHIENKLASGRFTLHQPELYQARAKLWMGRSKYGNYHEWDTVLLAPTSFLQRNAESARKFGATIPHEEISVFVPEFGSNAEMSA
jgi:hypothetical protein